MPDPINPNSPSAAQSQAVPAQQTSLPQDSQQVQQDKKLFRQTMKDQTQQKDDKSLRQDKQQTDKNSATDQTINNERKNKGAQSDRDKQPTPETLNEAINVDTAAPNKIAMASQASQARQASAADRASPAELTDFITNASQKIMLSRADGAQNATLRIELNDDLLPQTQLTAQKMPDGSLNLTFATDNPQSAALLQQAQSSLAAHMQQTQNINVHINLTNEQGQPVHDQPQNQTGQQNNPQDQQQNKKNDLNWDQVEAHVKKL